MANAAPHLIERCFVWPRDTHGQPCISNSGKYVVRLWDDINSRPLDITIDD